MSIEKSSISTVQPAANTKGPSTTKVSKGAAPPNEKGAGQDLFSDLLLGLGAEEADGGDASLASLQVEDQPIAAADPQAEGAVALLAQQDWIPIIIPITSDAPNDVQVIAKADLTDPLVPIDIGLAKADVSLPGTEKRKAVLVGNNFETLPAISPVGRTPDITENSKRAPKNLLSANSAGTNAAVDQVAATRSNASQFERKAIAEMAPRVDTAHLVGVQTGVEFNLNGLGVQSEIRREKTIFKSGVLETNTAMNSRADLSQPVSNVEALVSDGSVGTSFAEPTQGTYWVSSDMKNAQMTLDDIGDGSVDVSISLHGKEAHISFRTDEEQTRAALQDAESTLKDMLRREGLELSGVSVGLAGSNLGSGAGRGQDSRPRADFRQFKIDSGVQSSDGERRLPLGQRQSSSLDVFV